MCIRDSFSPSELVARVDAIHRRVTMARSDREPVSTLRQSGAFTLDIKSRTLYKTGEQIDLDVYKRQA